MKKIIYILVCCMLTMMVFVACGKKDSETDENNGGNKSEEIKVENLDVVAVADALIDNVEFVDDMTPIEAVDFFTAVFTIKAEDVVTQKTYMSTGATAELVSAVECADEDAAARVKERFEAYTADLSSQYADYKPEECEKLDNPVLKVYGKYVIICASDDNDKATSTIEEQVK